MASAASNSSNLEDRHGLVASPPIRRDERRVGLLVLCLLALAVGTVTGVGAVLLRALIGLIHNASFHGVFTFRYDANILEGPSPFGDWVFFSPIIGGVIVVWLVRNSRRRPKATACPR